MKLSITSIIASLALVMGAQAGPMGGGSYSGGKQPVSYGKGPAPSMVIPAPAGCECFAPGGALSIFAAGYIPEGTSIGGGLNAFDHDDDDVVGGGIGIEQFLTRNFGYALTAAWYGKDSTIHNYTLDAILRLPLGDLCIAPYALGGGGVHTNGSVAAIGRLGAGIDIRLPGLGCKGVFADYIYTFGSDKVLDSQIARVGLKLPF